jgi:hypothetical protein
MGDIKLKNASGGSVTLTPVDMAADISISVPQQFIVNTFSGTGAQVSFTLTRAPYDKTRTLVFVNGLYQNKSTYSVSGTTLTFNSAPSAGTNNIEVNTL